jgi:DnaK suppressor protein
MTTTPPVVGRGGKESIANVKLDWETGGRHTREKSYSNPPSSFSNIGSAPDPPILQVMKHLTPDQLTELEEELRRQLLRLERSMGVTNAAMEPVQLDQTAVGRLSRMDSLQNQSLTRNLQEREQVKLAHLLDALERLEGGTFGLCTECGAEIPFERLFIMPEAASCGSCGG